MKINTPEEAIEQIRRKTIRSALSAMRLSIKEQQSEGFFWWESAMIKKQKAPLQDRRNKITIKENNNGYGGYIPGKLSEKLTFLHAKLYNEKR